MEAVAETKQAATPAALESDSLGMEMATAYDNMVGVYREHLKLTTQEAFDKADEPPADGWQDRVLKCRSDQLTWMDFAQLTKCDPDLSRKRWDELKQIARNELKSGHRAAKIVEGATSSPSVRAEFIALREDLAAQWQPRNGIEWTLIDTIAHAFTLYEYWTQSLMIWSMLECEGVPDKANGEWNPPRVSDSDAINQAAAMADRFNRIFLRSIRALRDLRRYSATVIVQNAGNVNVAEQQVNVGN